MRPHLTRLVALATLIGAGAGGALLFAPGPPKPSPIASPEDDLALLVSLFDGGPSHAAARDLLLAGGGELYLARASDRTVVTLPKIGGAARVLAQMEQPVWGMALAGGALWLSTTSKSRGRIVRLDVRGGAPVEIAAGLAHPGAVASDGHWVFVVDVDRTRPGLLPTSSILRIPAAGGPSTVMGRCQGEVTNVALDDEHAYWADRFEGALMVVPKTGGEPRALVTERGLPGQVVVDGTSLYWVEKRSETLWAMPKEGGTPRQVAQDFAGFANLVVGAKALSWSTEAAVEGGFRVISVSKDGGEASAKTDPVEAIDALATDGEHVFWARRDAVAAIPKQLTP